MANFEHTIEFEYGPSCGFHAPPGSIHTCDIVQYMSIDSVWYRVHECKKKDISAALEECTDELQFQALIKQMEEDKIITRHK